MRIAGDRIRIAVLTATRDRLPYTEHCFKSLRDNSGCLYDHYVLDNGSTDGTVDFLRYKATHTLESPMNLGVSVAMNRLIDHVLTPDALPRMPHDRPYDVIVKFDNDCELLTPRTLRDVSQLALEHNMILSPRIHGLNNPPATSFTAEIGCHRVDVTTVIGGIFMAVPAKVFADGYRHDESNPLWGGDDTGLCAWFRGQGGQVGYVQGYDANHYMTTKGQWADQPSYFARTQAEGKVAL